MTDKLTDEELEALKGIKRPFGAGEMAEATRMSLLAKGLIEQKGAGVLVRTPKGNKAVS